MLICSFCYQFHFPQTFLQNLHSVFKGRKLKTGFFNETFFCQDFMNVFNPIPIEWNFVPPSTLIRDKEDMHDVCFGIQISMTISKHPKSYSCISPYAVHRRIYQRNFPFRLDWIFEHASEESMISGVSPFLISPSTFPPIFLVL